MTDVIAHRGVHRGVGPDGYAPLVENTVDAFRAAVAAGVAGVELDARRTADGAVVVYHDPLLDDGRAVVSCLRADLPERVPSLADALDACAGAWVNIEIKNDPGEPDFDETDAVAVAVLAHLDGRVEALDTWLLSSFRRTTVDRCRVINPAVPTAWLTDVPVTQHVIGELAAAGHVAVHPVDPTVDAPMITACHAAGLRVNTWTCNEPARAVELAGWGIDGIFTDVPAEVIAALSS